jgi:hypothetical protein
MDDGSGAVSVDDLVCGGNAATWSGGCGYVQGDATLTNVDATDNTAAWGAGFFLDASAAYVVNGTVADNAAAQTGGGAYLYDGATLGSVTSDWGTGSTDNTPDDVYLDTWGTAYAAWSSGATFTCYDYMGACY